MNDLKENQLHYTDVTLSLLADISEQILKTAGDIRVFYFYGNLGAGKTTMIKEMCLLLQYSGVVTSPTFSIVNQYNVLDGCIYHMDLYRLNSTQELFEAGIEEYLYSEQYCFIEWPQLLEANIHLPHCTINISLNDRLNRNIEVNIINTPH